MDRLDADSIWLIAAAGLVAFIPLGQIGLGMASSRPAGSRGVAPRVASDLVIALLVTWLVGYSWVHGASLAGWVGLEPGPVDLDGAEAGWRSALATWHGLAIGAAVVIAGGGGTGRARPLASLLLGLIMSALVLPLVARMGPRPLEALVAGRVPTRRLPASGPGVEDLLVEVGVDGAAALSGSSPELGALLAAADEARPWSELVSVAQGLGAGEEAGEIVQGLVEDGLLVEVSAARSR